MNLIIVGCGKIGTELVKQLSIESHDIVVIDKNPALVDHMVSNYDVMGVCGDGSCCDVLEEAYVGGCTIFISTTASDELNILCCMIARKMKAQHCIARVRNPLYNSQLVFMREELGLSMMVNPEALAAREIARVLQYPSAINIESFGRGRVDLVEFKVREDSVLANVTLREIMPKIKLRFLVCAIQRGNEVIIPEGNTVILPNDKLHFAAAHDQISKFFKLVNSGQGRVRTVLIIGGGNICYYLARMLTEEMGMRVTVIEKDKERCEFLSEHLRKIEIINNNGSDHDWLVESGSENYDACVTLTGIDEQNIVLSLYAKTYNISKVVTKVTRLPIVEIAESVGLDCVISPKEITSNIILQFVRAKQNVEGSNIITLYKLLGGEVEAIEFIVRQEAHYVNVPISELKLNKNSLIVSIIRGNKQIIPNGTDRLLLNDSVVVVSTNKFMRDLDDIFQKDI